MFDCNAASENAELFVCVSCDEVTPGHYCVITPDRPGQCGRNDWERCMRELRDSTNSSCTPYRRVTVGSMFAPPSTGSFAACSNTAEPLFNPHSISDNPPPVSWHCECVSAVVPGCNGIMIVGRNYSGPTPCGMNFQSILEHTGRGVSIPGFTGHARANAADCSHFRHEGGVSRLVWMDSSLRATVIDELSLRASKAGLDDFEAYIADETIAVSEPRLLEFLNSISHPALSMRPIIL